MLKYIEIILTKVVKILNTLKDVWEQKMMSPTQVAGLANISVATLYKINRKERVNARNLASVLQVLGLSRQQYEALAAGN